PEVVGASVLPAGSAGCSGCGGPLGDWACKVPPAAVACTGAGLQRPRSGRADAGDPGLLLDGNIGAAATAGTHNERCKGEKSLTAAATVAVFPPPLLRLPLGCSLSSS
ncbi:unnamed protein product, partial [Ixodes hexagonus]